MSGSQTAKENRTAQLLVELVVQRDVPVVQRDRKIHLKVVRSRLLKMYQTGTASGITRLAKRPAASLCARGFIRSEYALGETLVKRRIGASRRLRIVSA